MDSHASNKAVSSRSNISKKWVNKSEAARRMKISRRSVIRYARQGLIRENGSGAVPLCELQDLLKKPAKGGSTGPRPRRTYKLTVRGIAAAVGLSEKEVRRRLRDKGVRVQDGLNKASVRAVLLQNGGYTVPSLFGGWKVDGVTLPDGDEFIPLPKPLSDRPLAEKLKMSADEIEEIKDELGQFESHVRNSWQSAIRLSFQPRKEKPPHHRDGLSA